MTELTTDGVLHISSNSTVISYVPLTVYNKEGTEILSVQKDGGIFLRGNLIGSDEELAYLLSNYCNLYK